MRKFQRRTKPAMHWLSNSTVYAPLAGGPSNLVNGTLAEFGIVVGGGFAQAGALSSSVTSAVLLPQECTIRRVVGQILLDVGTQGLVPLVHLGLAVTDGNAVGVATNWNPCPADPSSTVVQRWMWLHHTFVGTATNNFVGGTGAAGPGPKVIDVDIRVARRLRGGAELSLFAISENADCNIRSYLRALVSRVS